MPRQYSADSWFWDVAERSGGGTPIYHSALGAYVAADHPDFLAFLADTDPTTGATLVATNIATELELHTVLSNSGVAYLGATPLELDPLQRIRARLGSLAQTISHANTDTINFDASRIRDPLGIWGGALNPNRIDIPVGQGGVYDVKILVAFDESSAQVPGVSGDGNRVVGFREVGTGAILRTKISADAEDETAFGVSAELELKADTSYRVFVRQNCGGDLDVVVDVSLRRVE